MNIKPPKQNYWYLIQKKRDKAREVGFKIFDATEKLKWIKEVFTLEQVINELIEAQKMLEPIMNKYDYSKLAGRN